MGAKDWAELTVVWPFGNTALSPVCSEGKRSQTMHPNPQQSIRHHGSPPDSQSWSPVPPAAPTLKLPLWAQSGLWVSCTTAHSGRMGKTNALSAADRISWPNFLFFLKPTF